MYRVPPTCTNWTCFSPRQPFLGQAGHASASPSWFLLLELIRCRYAVCRYAARPDGFVPGGSDPPGQYRPIRDTVLAETFVSRLAAVDELVRCAFFLQHDQFFLSLTPVSCGSAAHFFTFTI